MKTITVYSTRGQQSVKVETEANTWGELKKDLTKNGVDYSGMKVIVGETKSVLELESAVLPKGLTVGGEVTDNCTIFLSVLKQKAGSINSQSASYADLRNFIKTERAKSEANANFFGDYTHATTDNLRKLVTKYQTKSGVTAQSVKQTPVLKTSNTATTPSEVVNLLTQAIAKIKTLPGYVDNSELEALHQKSMEIEFELGNVA